MYVALALADAQDRLHARTCPVHLPVVWFGVDSLTYRLIQVAGIRSI
jgi:hypothetical protein